jgi:ubiquinone biosynthesis protein
MDFTTKSLQLTRRIRHMGRLAQIVNVFARHGLWSLAERMGLEAQLTPEQVREAEEIAEGSGNTPVEGEGMGEGPGGVELRGLPARLRRSFEELGPAFVKLGQVLAVREDLLPREYIDELCKLHYNVQALPFSQIQQVLREELGEARLAAFASISEKPLAAGSIAQVHQATLKTGEKVVVKVQRPGIEQQMRVDLSLMEELAGMLERYISETRVARPRAMIAEFSRGVLGELDFVREAGNIAKISRNFKDVEHVVLPEVHWAYCTTRVLTMSMLEGLPAWDRDKIVSSGLDPEELVERGFGMFLKMVFVDGLFHGDLHPGNLLALPDNRVGVIDFGLTVHLGKTTREHLAGLLVALVQEDFSRAVMHYVELASPSVSFDAAAFEHEIGNALAPFIGLRLQDLRTGRLFWDLARAAARHGAPMPQELIVFIKTLVSFEGIGQNLFPGFDMLKTSEKYTADIVSELYSPAKLKEQALVIARDMGQLARHAPLLVRRILRAALDGELSMTVKSEEMGQLATAMDRSSARTAVAVIIGALIIGSSILIFAAKGAGAEAGSLSLIGHVGFGMAGLLGCYVIWSILRPGSRM